MANPLTQDRILETLDSLEITYLTDNDGDPVAVFPGTDDRPAIGVLTYADGSVFVMRVEVHTPIAHVPLECLTEFCNTWNRRHRWPTAASDHPSGGTPRLMVSTSIPYPDGVSKKQLGATIQVLLSAAAQFAGELYALTRNNIWTTTDTTLANLLTPPDTMSTDD